MKRSINLRQVEAFKAVIENGTVSRAAEMLHISQPAISKLIAHLEDDIGLKLFERLKGRLAPTDRGMRLYEEIERVFVGLRQIENAVDVIRREEQERLQIGVMPALSGAFIRQATMNFLNAHPGVYCSIHSRSSHWIGDWLATRKLDVGVLSSRIENPYITCDPFMEHPLVCIMPLDHPLSERRLITPDDIADQPFISFDMESYTARRVATVLDTYNVSPNIVMTANVSGTLCEFVAAGLGISLVHPLYIGGVEKRVAVRRFEPSIPLSFHLCRPRESRNEALIEAFVEETRVAGTRASRLFLNE